MVLRRQGVDVGQGPAEPFRIAGNLYYVGATDAAAFLITGPKGHIVLDGGYPSTAPMIMASIAKLGFSIKDVKVLLNSEPHPDHAGGLGVLQQESGAELWASEAIGGHTRGCTSWSFVVHDGDRVLNVVSACDLGRLATSQYPEQAADLERSVRVLRSLPVDIWVT